MKSLHKMRIVATITIGLVFAFVAGVMGLLLWFSGASGFSGMLLSIGLAFTLVLIQWYFSPALIKKMYGLKKVKKTSKIYKTVKELVNKSELPMPEVWVMKNRTPNAFAFGRKQSDSNVCVTTGLINSLSDDELRAVIGHELGHIKYRDMVVMTLASVIPLLFYYIAISFRPRRGRKSGSGILIFLGAMFARMIGQLIVLWLSRVREYSADAFSAYQTSPESMMKALAKIGYHSSRLSKKEKGLASFYVSDPQSVGELSEVSDVIGMSEEEFRKKVSEEQGFSFRELLMTHPLMSKRIMSLKKLGVQD